MLKLLNEASYPEIMVLLREKLQHQGKPYKLQDMLEISHLFKRESKARRKELSWKDETAPCPHLTLLAPETERWSFPAQLLTSVSFAIEADSSTFPQQQPP